MILLLSLFFLLSRVLFLLFALPDLSNEELLRGTLTKELIEGLKIPFFDYAVDHYQGGALVYSVLTVPSFLFFGKNVFSLRLTAVFFQYGALITWYLFMKRFFGGKPALYTALLYLFSPPWLTLFSMFANGSHAESLLFTISGLFLLYTILHKETCRSRNAFFLGLVSGFGSYFTYGFFVSVVSFVLFWYYEDRNFFRKREFFFFLFSFLVGLSPRFLYNFLYPSQGVDQIKAAFLYPYHERLFIIPFRFLKLATLKTLGVLSFNYRKGSNYYTPHMTPLNFIYYAALLSCFLALSRVQRKDKKTHFFFLFVFVYLGIAGISRFVMDTYINRYFIPLFPIFFAVIALGLTSLEKISGTLRKASLSILFLLLAMGIKGNLNLLSAEEFASSLRYQGYSYHALGGALSYRYAHHLEKALQLGKKADRRLSSLERLAFYHGLSQFDFLFEEPGKLKKYFSFLKEVPEMYHPFFLRQIGYGWGSSERLFSEKVDDVRALVDEKDQPYVFEGVIASLEGSGMKPEGFPERILRGTKHLSLQNQRAFVYALGKLSWSDSVQDSLIDKCRRHEVMEDSFTPSLLAFYYRGVGALMANLYSPLSRQWPFSLGETLKTFDPDTQALIYWGAGFETPLLYEDPFEYERMKRGIPSDYQQTFQKGIEDRIAWGGRNYWIEGEGNPP